MVGPEHRLGDASRSVHQIRRKALVSTDSRRLGAAQQGVDQLLVGGTRA
jgi:hypothetical protein